MRGWTALLLLAVALAACGGRESNAGLSDLTGVDELRTQFNEDRGEARLLLLLSPT